MNDIFDDYKVESKEIEETYRNTIIKKKSILGLISVYISFVVLCSIITSIATLVAAIKLKILINNDNTYIIIGLVTFMLALCSFIGVLFGIGNLLEKNTKKISGIIGLSCNGFLFLGILLVIISCLLQAEGAFN